MQISLQYLESEIKCQVLAYRVILETMNAAIALIEVDRTPRQIPVNDGMTVPMEIQSLLPYRGAGQHKGKKR